MGTYEKGTHGRRGGPVPCEGPGKERATGLRHLSTVSVEASPARRLRRSGAGVESVTSKFRAERAGRVGTHPAGVVRVDGGRHSRRGR